MVRKIGRVSLSVLLALLCVVSICFFAPRTPLTAGAATKKTVLKITKQPTSVVAVKGTTAKVTFSVRGDSLKYTWYFKDAKAEKFTKSGITKKSYEVAMTSARNKRQVYCVVKDKYGKSARTKTVTLYQGTPLKITKQPTSVVAAKGTTAKVTFSVRGDSLKYTWYVKNAGAKSFSKSSITKSAYQVTMSSACSGRQVYCVVKDKYGKSVKTETVTLYQGTPLKITKQPTSVVAAKGSTAKVSFSVRGDSLKYTWYVKNAGAKSFSKSSITKSAYQVTMSSACSGQQVYCVVKDKYGKSVRTKTVTLYQGTPLKITKQPSSVAVSEGSTAKVSFSVRGDSLKYTWYIKNAGAKSFSKSSITKSAYQVTMSNACSGRQVYCVIKDKYGKSVKTETVTLLQTMRQGVYTFYNTNTGKYLSYNGNTLTLSNTAAHWDLKETGNAFYVYANNTDLLLDIHNAYVAPGTTVKIWPLTGYEVQKWKVSVNANGTYSFLSAVDNTYCLGFNNGKAELQKRSAGSTAQEWKAVNVSSQYYCSVSSKNKVIELRLPTDITTVISLSRLQKWANDLETAYNSFYELTNYKPYKSVVVEAYLPCKYTGYVVDNSNIIHVDKDFVYRDLEKMAARENDWNFCVLHEMGHMFDCKRIWNFESEMMTDFKLAYVLEKNGACAAPAEFGAATAFYGKDIIRAYEILGGGFESSYDIYSCAERFLEIKEDIGWEPFKKTFRYFQSNHNSFVGLSKVQRFEKFVALLSTYSGKDIRSYFTDAEWNTVINTLK